ncbi:CobQ/CobB/MinD/ParA nucleotide binding domain protein [Aeromicrobium marinum DSM 15272]|uniref:CobQ/CobB/MinD/ParA nucleotide binding domain protein n=1 Tax=Aeromicrobium marinum DSM 15272 TaxID=585531 RepID=E2SDL4_9ACTN|nr:AAA family ATPase [Aeromicrobium marinum]EFQ82591.1 CobQ/CobB/MinD/ParA nucleotide binding domain protein [Aeromicrobium marinum DSM 15272]
MTRTLILGGDDALMARINVLPGTQVVALSSETIQAERFDLLRSLDPQALPDLIMLCEELPIEWSLELARATDERYPTIDLVLVGEYSAEVVVEAMRSGVRDIVTPEAPDSRLVEVLRRAEQHRVAGAPLTSTPGAAVPAAVNPEDTRVIVVVSPKGGVGKTSISTNLAIGLAEQHPSEVVLVDLDLQFGDVASTLNINPTSTMEHALTDEAAEDTFVLKTMLAVHPSGFHVLPGADSPAATEHATGRQIRRLIEQLATQFAYVVVDTAAGLDEPTLAALEVADDVIVVSTMDVSCVRGVRKEIELLLQLELLPASRMVVLNLADRQSGMRVKDVEAVIGLPVDVVIPRAPEVQLASNHGEPIMLKGRKKGGPFVKAVHQVIDRLARQGKSADVKHRRVEVA